MDIFLHALKFSKSPKPLQAPCSFAILTAMEDDKKIKSNIIPHAEELYGDKAIDQEIRAMLEAAVHFGHRKTRQHPNMEQYVFSIRNNVSIIDLNQTKEKLAEVSAFLKAETQAGKMILFVDTRPSTRALTKAVAEELEMPYVVERWSGGIITNWKTISNRLEYFKNLEEKKASVEEWAKCTKKEKHNIEEELKRLKILWGGIKNMTKLPDLIFIVDMRENALAVKEARLKEIPIVAIADTNTDPTLATYFIPANDDALSSVKYILERVKSAIIEGRK